MGGLTGAVHWWEEWQLRVLVLTSLLIQFFLYFFPFFRRRAIPDWFRFILWLAYRGGDAVAIYALATLFNRHKDQCDGGVDGGTSSNTLLEVVWAPVLLIHLGGQDGVTAYNIEDNELWSRHLLTAGSQVTVAVYVFCKSWPSGGGDKMLLLAAIPLFIVGVVKCFTKAWAFKRASIYSLASLGAVAKNITDGNMCNTLEEYVNRARDIVIRQQPEGHHHHQVFEEEDPGTAVMRTSQARALSVEVMKKRALACLRGLSSKDEAAEDSSNHPRSRLSKDEAGNDKLKEEDPGTAVMRTSQARALSVEVMKKRALACLRGLSSTKDEAAEDSSNHPRSRLSKDEAGNDNPTSRQQEKERLRQRRVLKKKEKERLFEERGEASKLFVDLSSSYHRRIGIFEKFWGLSEDRAYGSVQKGLAGAFYLLYTKLKTTASEDSYKNMEHASGSSAPEDSYKYTEHGSESWGELSRGCIYFIRILLPWAPIGFFHHSHREAYNGIDVKVTYALLCCTTVLEYCSLLVLYEAMEPAHINKSSRKPSPKMWPETVAQYSLAGYFARNKKHSIKMGIVSFIGCKDFVDQLWCMDPCFTSARITSLVLRYLRDGWSQKIKDAATYRNFNNHSNHWALNMNNRPMELDECVLLWHLATDFCFFSSSFPDHKCALAEPETTPTPTCLMRLVPAMAVYRKRTSVANNQTSAASRPQCSQESAKCKAVQCRQMSNYMVYLLFVNPEMLLPGSRRNLFKTAYDELKGILNLKDWEWNPVCWSRCMPCGVELMKEEAVVMKKLIEVMQKKAEKRASEEESSKEVIVTVTEDKSERSSQEESSMNGSNKEENFIDQAWDLAQRLLTMEEMEMWKEIQNVWVQMLCFSASRCRGYLHAKALGKGGEFLSYVWLLLFYMGMKTFSERLQRELLPSCQGNNDTAPPPTSEVCTNSTTASTS